MSQTKSGFIAILGRPNVGKSTLLNGLVGEKVSIVTDKPQTTRNRITGVKTIGNAQMVFLDTPGIYRHDRELCRYMRGQAFKAMKGVDLALFVTDRAGTVSEDDRYIISRVKERELPAFFVLNKTDLMDNDSVLTTIDIIQREFPFSEFFPVSALEKRSITPLGKKIIDFLPEGPFYFPEDASTDQPDTFLMAEMIREKLFQSTQKEVPYSAAVVVERIEERQNGVLAVFASVFVERDSQKGIIIGKGGRLLKKIGTKSREDMEARFGTRIYLDLRVKVKRDWSRSVRTLKDVGYE